MKTKFKFTIAKKLGLGFGILITAFFICILLIYSTLYRNTKINNEITEIYSPSVSLLNNLFYMINDSKMLIKNWAFIEKLDNTPDKIKLKDFHTTKYNELKENITSLAGNWSIKEQDEFSAICISISTLFEKHKFIMERLSTYESYDDMMNTFEVYPLVERKGEIILLTDEILKKITNLTVEHEKKLNNRIEILSDEFRRFLIILGLLLILGGIVTAYLTIISLTRPINSLKDIILSMRKGILPEEKINTRTDEIGEMSNAVNLLIEGLQKTSRFSSEIGNGNFDYEFEPLSDQDKLGNSLMTMRENLKKAHDNDVKRNWATVGLAQFGEILRSHNDDIEKFSDNIISNLVKYMGANQGSLFIVNDDDCDRHFLELKACYAWNKKKYIEKEIELGEGLAGRAWQESDTIYLTEIPENYISITSGLGEANPTSILIVPLKIRDEVHGIIEIASFKKFQMFEMEFIHKLSESIASTLSGVKTNMRTVKLLNETQQMTEEMRSQEEEMQQNIEEMHATQEEMARKESDLEEKIKEAEELQHLARLKDEEQKSTIEQLNKENKEKLDNVKTAQSELAKQKAEIASQLNAIGKSYGTIEFDMKGYIITVNDKYLEMAGIERDNLIGKHQSDFMSQERVNSEGYKSLWPSLKKGESHVGGHQYFFEGKEKWFYETFSPVVNEKGVYYKVFGIANNISKLREKEAKDIQTIQELQEANKELLQQLKGNKR